MHSTLKSRTSRIKLSHPQSLFEERLQRVLLDIRSSPSESTGETPAYCFMGRTIRTTLPSLDTAPAPTYSKSDLRSKYERKKGVQKAFGVGTLVWTRQEGKIFSKAGKVTRVLGPYTYEITFPNAKAIYNQRNKKIRSDSSPDEHEDFQEEAYESVPVHDPLSSSPVTVSPDKGRLARHHRHHPIDNSEPVRRSQRMRMRPRNLDGFEVSW